MIRTACLSIAGLLLWGGAPVQAAGQGWQETGTGSIKVVHQPRHSGRALEVLAWAEAQTPLPGLPAGFPSRARIILADSEAAWDSITEGLAPEWSAAVARPALGELVIPTYSSERTAFTDEAQTLRHEWAHLGLHEYLEGLQIPRWFDEGYAELAGGAWDAEAAWRLRVAIALGSVPPLDSLQLQWPRGGLAARNAYFLSATAVEALEGDAGDRGMGLFLAEWRRGRDFEGALASVYGHTVSSLERAWREHLKERYDWLWVASRVLAGWTFLVLLALVMRGFRRGRRRTEMAGLRARDAEGLGPEYDPPMDYDPEQPSNLPPTSG